MARTRKLKVSVVNIDVDETSTHWLVFVSPRPEAQMLGISYHRARLPKCSCLAWQPPAQRAKRCKWCVGWSADAMGAHVGRLLRSYPKQTVTVPVEKAPVRRIWADGSGREVAA